MRPLRHRAAADLGNVPMAQSFERLGYVDFERALTMVGGGAEKGRNESWARVWGGSATASRICGGRRGSAGATVCFDIRRPSWKEARDMRANSRTTTRSTSLSRSRPVRRAVSDPV